LMNENGKVVGKIKSIQAEKQSLKEAVKGQQIAISMDDTIFGRDVNEKDVLYTFIPKKDALLLLEKYKIQLSDEELQILEKIQRIEIGLEVSQ